MTTFEIDSHRFDLLKDNVSEIYYIAKILNVSYAIYSMYMELNM